MKKVKRLLTIGVAVTLMFCMSLSFVGCKEKEVQRTIPDGRYEATNHSELTHYVYVGDSRNYDYFFEIEEDHVARYSSGMLTYQANRLRPAAPCLQGTRGWRRRRWRCGSSFRPGPSAAQLRQNRRRQ